jgi:hypothetical protein
LLKLCARLRAIFTCHCLLVVHLSTKKQTAQVYTGCLNLRKIYIRKYALGKRKNVEYKLSKLSDYHYKELRELTNDLQTANLH